MAFSKTVREQIIARDEVCQDTSGESCFGGLEACHLDHTKNQFYQSLMNGVALCTKHHLVHHLETDGENGLSLGINKNAIRFIADRIGKQYLDV